MKYQLIRRIPTMSGCSVDVGVTQDGREVIVKRALNPAAAASLEGYVRQLRRLRELEGIADYYPPLLDYTGDTVVFPCYSRGTLDSAAAGSKDSFRRLVSEAVGCVFAISAHRSFPTDPADPLDSPTAAARAFWRLQLTQRLDRLDQAGVDRAGEPFRSISRALDDGLLDRVISHAVSRPLGLAAHGDLSLHNVLLTDPGEAGPAFRLIDLRGSWAGGLPWWDPVLDLATLVTFHGLTEPALELRDGIARSPDPGLAALTRDELVEDALAQPSVQQWVAGDPAWRLRTQLGIVARLLGSVSVQLSSAPKDRQARAGVVTDLLSHEWRTLLSC
ncbi:MAG: hypothetical protein ABIQ09_18160 [Jatrophihabitantaceae bacterium]